jgi:hypothetical protein
MQCVSCGSNNPDGMKFCGECGTPLKSRCSQCGFANPPKFKFCGECGAPLMEQSKVQSLKSKVSDSNTEAEACTQAAGQITRTTRYDEPSPFAAAASNAARIT